MKPEQITAWALDEASPEERQHLEAALLENPKDKLKAEETKAFCDFLISELRDDSLALTDKQRSELKAQPVVKSSRPSSVSGTSALKPPAHRVTRWNMGVIVRLAVAACLVLGGFWTWQSAASRRHEALTQEMAVAVKPTVRVSLPKTVDAKKYSNVEAATRQAGKIVPLEKQTAVVAGKLPAPAATQTVKVSSSVALTKNQGGMTDRDVNELKKLQDQTAYKLNFGNMGQMQIPSPPVSGAKTDGVGSASLLASASAGFGNYAPSVITTLSGANTFTGGTTINGGTLKLTPPAPAMGQNGPVFGSVGSAGGGGVVLNSNAVPSIIPGKAGSVGLTFASVERSDVTTIAPFSPAFGPPVASAPQANNIIQTVTGIPTNSSPQGIATPAAKPASVAAVMEPTPDTRYLGLDKGYLVVDVGGKDLPIIQTAQKQEGTTTTRRTDVSGESYTRIIENEMKEVAREPLSTLSIDVDTASYANVRRFLNQNMTPPPDAVRIEELVNYFPTDEEGPAHGAKEPFGVRIELAPCPWQPVHRLARIAIKGREMDRNRKPSNLVFLVDVSGSMSEPAKLPLVQQSLRMLTEQLGEGDHVTMVVYAGSSGVVLPPTSGEKKAEILVAIDRLSAGGSTHGSAGIKLAYEQAVAGFIKGGVNRVILCTDGDFNVGVSSPEELEKLIKHKAKTGVFLSVLGFGSGNLKDRTMETLADKGNGNYAYIDSLSEARKVLVEQMSGTLDTIAKDVKIQVEFNPALVRSYRLIGYENRLLAKEDFNDDTKDAGEIGAGHSVVALYEVVPATLPAGAESRPAVDSLKYQTPAVAPAQLAKAAQSGEVMTVKLRYKEPDSSLSKLIEAPVKDEGKTLTASSSEYKFSAAVAGFGLLLRDSAYKGTLSWETVRRLAIDGKGADKLGYRGEFLQLIDKARGLKETQN